MTITEAEKRCEELSKQISDIQREYDFGGFAKYCGRIETKPLHEELSKLTLAIIEAKETVNIKT